MKCDEFKILIEEYISGELDSKVIELIQKHVNECSSCKSYTEYHKKIDCMLNNAFKVPKTQFSLAPDFNNRLKIKISDASKKTDVINSKKNKTSNYFSILLRIAAVIFIISGVTLFYFQTMTSEKNAFDISHEKPSLNFSASSSAPPQPFVNKESKKNTEFSNAPSINAIPEIAYNNSIERKSIKKKENLKISVKNNYTAWKPESFSDLEKNIELSDNLPEYKTAKVETITNYQKNIGTYQEPKQTMEIAMLEEQISNNDNKVTRLHKVKEITVENYDMDMPKEKIIVEEKKFCISTEGAVAPEKARSTIYNVGSGKIPGSKLKTIVSRDKSDSVKNDDFSFVSMESGADGTRINKSEKKYKSMMPPVFSDFKDTFKEFDNITMKFEQENKILTVKRTKSAAIPRADKIGYFNASDSLAVQSQITGVRAEINSQYKKQNYHAVVSIFEMYKNEFENDTEVLNCAAFSYQKLNASDSALINFRKSLNTDKNQPAVIFQINNLK